jgi:hypothetical protein
MEHNVEIIESPGGIRVESAVVFGYPAHIHTYSEMILYEPFDGTVIVNDLHIRADSGCAVLIVPSDLHRIVVRYKVPTWGFSYSVLTEQEKFNRRGRFRGNGMTERFVKAQFAVTDDARGNNAGVVDNERVARTDVIEDIAENFMFERAVAAVNDHQT